MGLAADFVLIVVAGLAGGMLARALRLPLLVGYVVAGVFVGPNTAGPTVAQVRDIETLAEVGVALLLFSIGLEISFRDLRVVRRICLIGGPIQIVATIGIATIAAVSLLNYTPNEALWFGAMISVSSTMVVLKSLAAGGLSSSLAGRAMVGLLLVQNLAVIPMLIVLPQLATPENLLVRVATALALATAFVALIYFAGTRMLPPLFRRILTWGSRELFLVAVVATGIGIGAAMHAAGFSFALGAFVAGLILSESEFSHQALSDIVPLRDIFGLLFFVTVGMLFDPLYVARNASLIALVILGALIVKAGIFGVIARSFGYANTAPWLVGLGLSQIGEFSFVLARTGLTGGFVSKPEYDLTLAVTVVTMALSPMVFSLAGPLSRLWQRFFPACAEAPAQQPILESSFADHVIVGGYGRAGRAAALALREAGIPSVVVESSYALAADARGQGIHSIFGDISREEVLHAARVERARMMLLTMPDGGIVDLAVERGRRLNADMVVVARSVSVDYVRRLQQHNVLAVQPEFEGGLQIVRLGLLQCGQPDGDVRRIVEGLRREVYSNGSEGAAIGETPWPASGQNS